MLFDEEASQTVASILVALQKYLVDTRAQQQQDEPQGALCVYCWDAAQQQEQEQATM